MARTKSTAAREARSATGRVRIRSASCGREAPRGVVEVQGVDLVLARPGVGRRLEGAAQVVEPEGQERGVARVEAGRVEARARQLEPSPRQGERGGGGAGVGDEAQPLRRPRAVGRAVDAVGGHVHRLVDRELEDLEVARPRKGPHEEAEERDEDEQEREDEVAEDPHLDSRARRRGDAPHDRLDLLQALVGRHAVDELPQQEAVVLEEGGDRLGEGGGGPPVRGLHHVEDEAGRLLAVPPRHVPARVADQDDVEGDAHLADELDRLAHRVRARVPAARHVGPVLRVGVRDRVREQHHAQVGAAGVRRRPGPSPFTKAW